MKSIEWMDLQGKKLSFERHNLKRSEVLNIRTPVNLAIGIYILKINGAPHRLIKLKSCISLILLLSKIDEF
jgi:hypothetical protein